MQECNSGRKHRTRKEGRKEGRKHRGNKNSEMERQGVKPTNAGVKTGGMQVLKGQVSYETAAVRKYCALRVVPFVLSAYQFWVEVCQTMLVLVVHF